MEVEGGQADRDKPPPPIARPRRAATMETMEMLLLGLQPGEQWSRRKKKEKEKKERKCTEAAGEANL